MLDILANCRIPDFIGDLWAGVAFRQGGKAPGMEIVTKYGKDVFLHAVEEYLDYGERVSLAALKKLPKGRYSLEEQDQGLPWKVVVEVSDTQFIVDLRDGPGQGALQHEPQWPARWPSSAPPPPSASPTAAPPVLSPC